ncbi:MAG: ABC transporter ATP-binding protein [Myxococcales bacterium]|nr:ABC transporter ATP-binding protein [Myxococcales bacterium]
MAVLTSAPAQRGFADWQLAARFWPYVRPDAGWVALGVAVVPIMSVAGLLQPWLIMAAIDGPIARALAHQPEPTASWSTSSWSLGAIAGAFLGAVIAEYGTRSLQHWALQKAGFASLQRLRRGVFGHVIKQGAAFFDERASGNLLSRTTTDVEALGEVLTFGIVGIVGDVVDILAIVAAMVLLDLELTLVTALAAPVVIGVVQLFRLRLRFHSTNIRKSMAAASGHFQEALAGARIVQLHGREQATVEEYQALNFKYLDAFRRSNVYDAALYAIMDGVASLCIALLIWWGGARALAGTVTLGLLVAFIQYIQRVFVPVRELSGKVATIERALAALERIFGLFDVDRSLPSGSHAPAHVAGRVDVQGLDFSYDGRQTVLEGITLAVAPGEVLALVGPTGSGKSSLTRLLTRMYEPPPATVRLDGVPVEQWQTRALRRAIGVVPQDVVLFSGTLADNVALGNPAVTRDRIERALREARLQLVVDRLGGLDARVAEAGANLSAGERQLLSIARVLALDPRVVVFDEATANIDSETEQALQEAIAAVLRGRTAIVVAHRLSTIRRADRIAVLERGRVVEIGNHSELMRNNGLYARLVDAAARQATVAGAALRLAPV